jgi:hypothetical protein
MIEKPVHIIMVLQSSNPASQISDYVARCEDIYYFSLRSKLGVCNFPLKVHEFKIWAIMDTLGILAFYGKGLTNSSSSIEMPNLLNKPLFRKCLLSSIILS